MNKYLKFNSKLMQVQIYVLLVSGLSSPDSPQTNAADRLVQTGHTALH